MVRKFQDTALNRYKRRRFSKGMYENHKTQGCFESYERVMEKTLNCPQIYFSRLGHF